MLTRYHLLPLIRVSPSLTQSRALRSVVPLKTIILKDELIPHPLVTLVDPHTNTLSPPTSLTKILSTMNRNQFSLLLVDPRHDPPICKFIDKKLTYAKAQAKRLAAKSIDSTKSNPSGPPREVKLTWGVAPNDLIHKLSKAKELLGKGSRVSVVISNKSGGGEEMGGKEREKVVEGVKGALEGFGKLVRVPVTKGSQVILEYKRLET